MDSGPDINRLEELAEKYEKNAAAHTRERIEEQILDTVLGKSRQEEEFATYSQEQWKMVVETANPESEVMKVLLRRASSRGTSEEEFAVVTKLEFRILLDEVYPESSEQLVQVFQRQALNLLS